MEARMRGKGPLLAAGGVALIGLVAAAVLIEPGLAPAGCGSAGRLGDLARNIVSGGPPKDGIPPVDRPRYVPAAEANRFLAARDVVFGVNYEGDVRAYPQKVLVWHEIVNDELAGRAVSITYCPLTGSAVGFEGDLGGRSTTFGTSGKLVNSNLVMYDRATDSYWPQVLGTAITGPMKGTQLDRFPVVWTTWGRWRAAFPETLVLSTDTGYIRSYGSDPYGSYERGGTYYQSGGPLFPVTDRSDRFPMKEVVLGVEVDGNALAVEKDLVRRQGVLQARLGNESIVIMYDPALDDALAYKSAGRTFTYRDGEITDSAGSAWNIWGVSDNGERLEFARSFDVMWFAWYAFFPDTAVYEEGTT